MRLHDGREFSQSNEIAIASSHTRTDRGVRHPSNLAMVTVVITAVIKTAALLADLLKIMPALLRLTAVLSVLSNLFVEVLLGFVNAFFAVTAPVGV